MNTQYYLQLHELIEPKSLEQLPKFDSKGQSDLFLTRLTYMRFEDGSELSRECEAKILESLKLKDTDILETLRLRDYLKEIITLLHLAVFNPNYFNPLKGTRHATIGVDNSNAERASIANEVREMIFTDNHPDKDRDPLEWLDFLRYSLPKKSIEKNWLLGGSIEVPYTQDI